MQDRDHKSKERKLVSIVETRDKARQITQATRDKMINLQIKSTQTIV